MITLTLTLKHDPWRIYALSELLLVNTVVVVIISSSHCGAVVCGVICSLSPSPITHEEWIEEIYTEMRAEMGPRRRFNIWKKVIDGKRPKQEKDFLSCVRKLRVMGAMESTQECDAYIIRIFAEKLLGDSDGY